MYPPYPLVKRGTFLYAGDVACDVCIQKTDKYFGTGDHKDPPHVRDDRDAECYYVWYGSPTKRGEYNAEGGDFASLTEAIEHVERSIEGVKWQD